MNIMFCGIKWLKIYTKVKVLQLGKICESGFMLEPPIQPRKALLASKLILQIHHFIKIMN